MKCPIKADNLCVYCDYSKENLCDYPYIGNRKLPTIDKGETANWIDRGCQYYPVCIECPEPEGCLFEIPKYIQRKRTEMRAQIASKMLGDGHAPEEVADKIKTSVRNVQRMVRQHGN